MKANLVLLLISVLRGSTFMPDLTGPSMAYLKSTVTFECTMSVSTSPPIFDLIKDDGKILATRDDPQEDQPIRFYLKVSMESEGVYFCRVTSRGQKSMSNPVHLQVVIPVQGTYIVPDPDPPVLYERAGLILRCEVKKGTHLDYDWYHNKQEVTSPSSLYHLAENTMRVDSASERHAGTYSCVAKNRMKNNTRYSSSMPVTVHVKKYLSVPKLSFRLYHQGSGFHANISCLTAQGSPPVKFQLLLDGKSIAVQQVDLLKAWFSLPVTLGIDMGTVQCTAENEIQQLLSNQVNLEVAPVEGTARVLVKYFQSAESMVTSCLLQCVIIRGTFPLFSWSFNGLPLPSEKDTHAFTHQGNVLILTHLSAESLGYYSCRVRDSFNPNSSWVESEKVLIEMKGPSCSYQTTHTDFELVSVEIIAITFCCFLFGMVMGGACCLLRNINCERLATSHHHTVGSHGHKKTERLHYIANSALVPQTEDMETVIMEVEL